MVSEEGLNAYGAITWGQFFIYQGFNDRTGWMHTSSGVDNIDEYLETVVQKGDAFYYRVGTEERARQSDENSGSLQVPNRHPAEGIHGLPHAPRADCSRSRRQMDQRQTDAGAPQSADAVGTRAPKRKTTQQFRESMDLHTNSSNNTIYADADGTIAYFHSNFIPRRDTRFDWAKPVDGSDPATEWNGVLSIDETPGVLNPRSGWLYNTNNWPWSAAGPNSPKKADFPVYVERGTENARGIHAIRVLENKKDFTIDSLIAAAYDSYLPAFEQTLPALLKAWDRAPASNPLKSKLSEQIAALRGWDYRWAVTSVPTSLAVYWGDEIGRQVSDEARKAGVPNDEFVATRAAPDQLLQALATASDKLAADFGKWQTPWGDINRYQRLTCGHRTEVRRCRTEHPGRLHLGAMGIAGVVRRSHLSRYEEDVRHERQ